MGAGPGVIEAEAEAEVEVEVGVDSVLTVMRTDASGIFVCDKCLNSLFLMPGRVVCAMTWYRKDNESCA
jgi:hypothetical protein